MSPAWSPTASGTPSGPASPAAGSTDLRSPAVRPDRFRPDIEGLRAVAVLLVLVYHAGLPLRNGFLGVDVFFVISGFLITGLLVRELAQTGTISWVRFLARRVRRLLPAAALVLVLTAAVGWFVVPGLRRRELGGDLVAAALSVANWRFDGKLVDPPLLDVRQSVVQHYWSLSVEEQFYVVWPLALVAMALVLRRFGRRPTLRSVGLLLAVITLPSFAYAVWLTGVDPARAYFVTTTRAWELGVGAALAVWCAARDGSGQRGQSEQSGQSGQRGRARSRLLPAVVGWAGLLVVLGSAWWLPAGAVTPGAWTLVPTLGAAAVLWAGWTGTTAGPVRVLGTRPMVWIGGLSYSLYLWHWPAVMLTEWALHGLTGVQKVSVVVASVVPAWLGHRFLEQPVHHSTVLAARATRTVALGAALSAAAVLAALPLTQVSSAFRTTPVAGPLPAVGELGASTLAPSPSSARGGSGVDDWEWLTPDPQLAGHDRPAAGADHCQVGRATSVPVACLFGLASGTTTVALVGDSKALQWLPALERLAPQRGWRIVTYAKTSCPFAAGHAQRAGGRYPSCDAWNDRVMAALRADPPDLVLTSGQATTAWDGTSATPAALVAGLGERWQQVRDLGAHVVVLADSPRSPDDLDVCAARHVHELTRCGFDRGAAVSGSAGPTQQRAARDSGTTLVDLTDAICPTALCPVAIGNVTVHRPGDHLTATYVRTLATRLGEALDETSGTGPDPVARP